MPSITEEDFEKGPRSWSSGVRWRNWTTFYTSDDYVKDALTNMMISAPTEKTCKDYDGFICKVTHLSLCKIHYTVGQHIYGKNVVTLKISSPKAKALYTVFNFYLDLSFER